MREAAVALALAGAVVSIWLACLAFARLSHALDRLHCVTFANVGACVGVTLAAFLDEGVTARSLKILLLALVVLATGAATSHATARALWLRQGGGR